MNNKKLKMLFGSNCRIKILKYYFKNPNGEFYIRELTTLLDEHFNNVRKEMIKLEEVGILEMEVRGKANFFFLRKNKLSHAIATVFGIDLKK